MALSAGRCGVIPLPVAEPCDRREPPIMSTFTTSTMRRPRHRRRSSIKAGYHLAMALTFLDTEVPREWWGESPTSIASVRAELNDRDLPTSFVTCLTRVLDELEQLMQPEDELYNFSSPPFTWEGKMGTGGYLVVRGGTVVHAVMTVRN